MRWLSALLLLSLTAAAPQASERRVLLSGFDRIRVDGPFEVHVSPGSAKAVISGDRRAIDRIDVHQEGRTLIVSPGLNGWGGWPGDVKAAPARIEVSVPTLRGASVIGSGRLAIDRIEGADVQLMLTGAGTLAVRTVDVDRFSATLTGTGIVAVQGRANKARFSVNGAGGFDAAGLVADDLTVRAESAGISRFAARYTAYVTNLGLGEVTVSGNPACNTQGPGPIRCGKGKAAD